MKKLMTLSCMVMFALFFAAPANSQPPTPEAMAQRDNEWMKSALSLTTAQVPKVEEINLKYAKKMREAFEQNRDNDEARRKARTEIQDQKRTELQSVLTADQLALYDKTLAERRANMQGPPR